jgi:hypothetical protein
MDSNQQHDEVVDGQQHDEVVGGDLLVGADAIRAFLIYLGMPAGVDPYYLRRAGRWPIGNTGSGIRGGGKLIASKRRLTRHAEEITRGPTAVCG